MQNDYGLVERLRALHVWPQFVADERADILRPRESKGLYAVGEVAHEAADSIEQLEAENATLKALVRGWHYLAVGPDEMGDYYTHKALIKASEPYASPALVALGDKTND